MYRILLFVVLLFIGMNYVESQQIDPASVDVSALSDAQVQRLLDEMQRRGLTEEQALALARSQGVPESQISMLRQRIRTLGAGTISDERMKTRESMAMEDFASGFDQQPVIYSKKAFFVPSEQETRLFGFHFFNSDNLTFEPGINYPVTRKYLVGPGDQFIIDVYGVSEMTYFLFVDRSGNITIPNVGPIPVGGFTLEEAEERIFRRLSRIYRDMVADEPRTFANIQLGQIKPITVNVVGEVFAPGTFTLPGASTAFNALYLAGGPNLRGSFREIRVIREGEVLQKVDVYDYLINGNSEVNVHLMDGDIIMVPTVRNRVRIGGHLIRTGLFETLEGESIDELIKYAGGFDEKAYNRRIELHRNTGRELEVRDVFADQYDDFYAQNGDSLYVGAILSRFANRVAIDGAVFRPGTYELTKDLTLSQLIERADGLREDAFMERGMILRLNENLSYSNVAFDLSAVISGDKDISLRREDVVTISSIDDMREARTIRVFGEVQRPGRLDFREALTLGDAIALAGGLKESASESYVEVTRRLTYQEAASTSERTGHLFQFTIPRSLTLHNDDASFLLQPYDQIFIRRAPGFVQESSIRISGEIMYAGEYALVSRNERLSDVIRRAGGLTPEAYLPGAMLTRERRKGKADALTQSLEQSDERVSFSGLDFSVIGIDLEAALRRPGSRDDIYLQDGDELVVPRRLQTVQVEGEVLNPISMPYIEGKGLRYYIDQSGGFGLRAKRRKAYVIYPNGTAAATRNYVLFSSYPTVMPGSQIVIPQKPPRTPIPATGWIAIGSGVSSLALTIVTVINQIGN
ncbi:SLBB domain-containing protein [Alkalitalea saponilacus]|uniref:Protein involved in polysaccharide export, contains SLBB domain of the beta-grasp fold n=1 Tax=Alkalitalea saponilacus TaxID=889453 RepID=A0A1T5FIX0_9BACT|nr:SLBB domain-containing protein [Alkalitalea saponilacus]ASB49408.1 sugar transporter [Alkalitalea saponilacus]SKB96133.1 protein involved in polysaccharide export, contains SLBB domain of the beta-grasp fold [Alkalitalea saponilacus]